jgi:hypothetical protein
MDAPSYPRIEPNPLAGNFCKYCGSEDIWVELRPVLWAHPITSFSLAGAQLKASASYLDWPHAVCGGCGHVSKGK